MNVDSKEKIAHLDDAKLSALFERNNVRIQCLLAEAASVRADQASIRAEMKRREWEFY